MADNQRDALIQVMIVLIVAVLGLALVFSLFGGGMMGGGMMGGMMGFGWLIMLLPIIFIIVLIYALLDRDKTQYTPSQYHERENPLQILERRYAGGEVSREDYLKMKEDLHTR